jgi:hypothetical protein
MKGARHRWIAVGLLPGWQVAGLHDDVQGLPTSSVHVTSLGDARMKESSFGCQSLVERASLPPLNRMRMPRNVCRRHPVDAVCRPDLTGSTRRSVAKARPKPIPAQSGSRLSDQRNDCTGEIVRAQLPELACARNDPDVCLTKPATWAERMNRTLNGASVRRYDCCIMASCRAIWATS